MNEEFSGSKISQTEAYTDQRLSKIYYISHHVHSIASQTNKKLDNALRMNLNTYDVAAENYQLMNYGLGIVWFNKSFILIFYEPIPQATGQLVLQGLWSNTVPFA